MRGEDLQQHEVFSYGSLEERVPGSHPLRAIRSMVDEALKELSNRFDEIYGEEGRKSIPPERLLRALLLQMLYSVRSERMLMEQMEPFVPLVRESVSQRTGMASDGIHQEPGSAAGGRGCRGVLLTNCGTSPEQEAVIGRALHGGWNAD